MDLKASYPVESSSPGVSGTGASDVSSPSSTDGTEESIIVLAGAIVATGDIAVMKSCKEFSVVANEVPTLIIAIGVAKDGPAAARAATEGMTPPNASIPLGKGAIVGGVVIIVCPKAEETERRKSVRLLTRTSAGDDVREGM